MAEGPRKPVIKKRFPWGWLLLGCLGVGAGAAVYVVRNTPLKLPVGRPVVFKAGTRNPVLTASGYLVARHRATVSAKSDVDCYRLDKEGFRAILAARPDFARDISAVLVDRNNDLLAKQNAAAHEVRAQSHTDLVGQIKSFFAIR